MLLTLKGKKLGMTQRFDEQGRVVPCTAIQVDPNVVVQIKEAMRDGYQAIQLASDRIETRDPRTAERRIGKPQTGHFKKADIPLHRSLHECRVQSVEGIEVGQQFTVEFFSELDYVDVTAKSKGKGFQGCMKRYNFSGAPASHGAHKVHRRPGSLGNRSTPGWVYPGHKMPGHMGNERVTVEGLRILGVEVESGLLLLKGAIPGARGSMVLIRPARKRYGK